MIRNFSQTSQEREIIKTAPDMVVYVEGLPYILNPYITTSGESAPVNFNDFVTAISTSYSVDSLIPTGSITLQVPNGQKHLFLTPGGGVVFDVMSSVKIYAKSYHYSPLGNTIYRRIFNGLIRSIDYADTPTAMELSLSISGVCRFLEIAQIDLNRAIVSNSSSQTVVTRSNQANMNIYQAIQDTLERQVDFSEFVTYSMRQDVLKQDLKEAIRRGYIAKWVERLNDLKKEIRVFTPDPEVEVQAKPAKSADAEKQAPEAVNNSQTETTTKKENKFLLRKLRRYNFDMSISPLKLFGAQLTSRLERLRHLIDIAGMEGYQDIDGLIIVKPPLYNLDSTILGEETNEISKILKNENLSERTNPFIIHLSEILTENYTEDEGSIRRTSMTLHPNWVNPNGLQVEAPLEIQQVVRYTDINLLKKFGARDEAPKAVGFLTEDLLANYAFAICELHKANRAYRTYNVSIPLRPELRLGYPIYFPHKDMYGYLTGAAISYNVGGQATMSLTMNFIRKRPMYPTEQTIVDEETKTEKKIKFLSAQPNLVLVWQKPDDRSEVFTAKQKSVTELSGQPATVSQPEKVNEEVQAKNDAQKQKGAVMETAPPTEAFVWRIQKDDGNLKLTITDKKTKATSVANLFYNAGFDPDTGIKPRAEVFSADENYMRRTSVIQPLTDEKGYEVVPVLPWGRYSTLRQALADMLQPDKYDTKAAEEREQVDTVLKKKVNTYLVSGLGTPGSAQVLDTYTKFFQKQMDKVDVLSFELDHFPTRTDPQVKDFVDRTTQPISALETTPNEEEAEPSLIKKLEVFLEGQISPDHNNRHSSLLPQNTDIGGYQPPLGPFDAVIQGMKATFDASAYGALFSSTTRRTVSDYFKGSLIKPQVFRSPTIGMVTGTQSTFRLVR